MSSELHTVRFPSGETEFRMSDNFPVCGDVLKRNGDNWIVKTVTPLEDGSRRGGHAPPQHEAHQARRDRRAGRLIDRRNVLGSEAASVVRG